MEREAFVRFRNTAELNGTRFRYEPDDGDDSLLVVEIDGVVIGFGAAGLFFAAALNDPARSGGVATFLSSPEATAFVGGGSFPTCIIRPQSDVRQPFEIILYLR